MLTRTQPDPFTPSSPKLLRLPFTFQSRSRQPNPPYIAINMRVQIPVALDDDDGGDDDFVWYSWRMIECSYYEVIFAMKELMIKMSVPR